MPSSKFSRSLLISSASLLVLSAVAAQATDFTVQSGQTVNTTETLGPAANETGLVQQGGAIVVNGPDAIASSSVGAHITNYGTITQTGPFVSYAIQTTATDQFVVNNGIINATGPDAYGFESSGARSNFMNNGTINVAQDGVGIGAFSGGYNIFTNNGSIVTTTGAIDEIVGMLDLSNNSTLVNNGTVALTANLSSGLYAGGISSTVTNSGAITMTGNTDYGLAVAGIHSSALNTGTIAMTGNTNIGMYAIASNSTLTNNGTIAMSGTGSFGMQAGADNTAITNNGIITATGTGSHAIEVTGNNDTVVLGKNSQTNGIINFAGMLGGLQYNLSGAGPEGSVTTMDGTVTGTHTTTITGALPTGARVVQNGNTVAVVTPDSFAASNLLITQTLNYTGDLVTRRQQLALLGDTTGVAGGTQYAASNNSLNDASPASGWGIGDRRALWAEGFGSYQERGASGDAPSSTARSGGVLGGIDLPKNDNDYRIGFYGGAFTGGVELGDTNFRTINSDGALAGGYIGKSYGDYFASLQLATGFSSNDSNRFTGIDIAKSNYDSYFVSPSLSVMRPMAQNGVTWVPSATLRYTAQFDGSYDETGSVANENVDSRTIQSLDARLMLDAHLDDMKLGSGELMPSFRAGFDGQTLLGGNYATVNTLGTNISFDPEGANNYVDGILGANLSYATATGPLLYLDGEGDLGLNKGGPGSNKGIIARLGARWKF